MSDSPVPSYEELAALVIVQAGQLGEQALLIEALRVEMAGLRRQAGRDSGNSSQPPSKDGLGARAKAAAEKRAQLQEADGGQGPGDDAGDGSTDRAGAAAKRKQGGQRGHRGVRGGVEGSLGEQDVLGTDETPAPLIAAGVAAETGEAYARRWQGH
jgi:hypothetical protein